jgi:photosystem II reaction center protein PsbP
MLAYRHAHALSPMTLAIITLLFPLGQSLYLKPYYDTGLTMIPKSAFAQVSNSTSNITQSTSTPANFSMYKDPEKRFTINYPADWNATPAANRFATSLVEFSNPVPLASLDIRLVKSVPFDVQALMVQTFGTTYDIPNFQLNQGVECQKYTIDGSKACSIIYTRTFDYSSDLKFAVMDVETVLKGNAYIFVYTSNLDNFDSNLPRIDKMINSFKVPTTGVP